MEPCSIIFDQNSIITTTAYLITNFVKQAVHSVKRTCKFTLKNLYWTLTYFNGGITSLECLDVQEESIARVLGSAKALTLLLPLLDGLSRSLILQLFLFQLPHALHLPWTQTLHIVLVSIHG